MKQNFGLLSCVVLAVVVLTQRAAGAEEKTKSQGPILAEVLAASQPGDWRALDPENTHYVLIAAKGIIQVASQSVKTALSYTYPMV